MALLIPTQFARDERHLLQSAPPMSASEIRRFPIPELQRLRALYFRIELRDRQARALIRLDQLDRLARSQGVTPRQLSRHFGQVALPGVFPNQTNFDTFDMLTPRPPGEREAPGDSPVRLGPAYERLIQHEPEPRPYWLKPDEPWPPRQPGS
jgi:hypothetical protein